MASKVRASRVNRSTEGSIYTYATKAGKRYRWQATVKSTVPGSPIAVSRVSQGGYLTAKEANAAMQEVLRNSRKGKVTSFESELLSEYAARWLAAKKVANTTRAGYEKILRVHIIPSLGMKKLKDIDANAISRFYRSLEKNGNKGRTRRGQALSANSVSKIHIVLGSILQAAVREGKLGSNPARAVPDLVQAPTRSEILEQQEPLTTWSANELTNFLEWDFGMEDELYPLWYLLGWTGLRRGEAVALQWQDINFKNKTLAIRRSTDSALRKSVKNSTKTRRNRSVSLSDATIEVLLRHRESRSQLGQDYIRPESFVFGTLDGTVRNPADVGERWSRTVRRCQAEFPDLGSLTIKGLRHTHATLLLESGVHAKVVQERLGHSNVTTTLNIYAHVTPTMQESAILRLEMYVKGEEAQE